MRATCVIRMCGIYAHILYLPPVQLAPLAIGPTPVLPNVVPPPNKGSWGMALGGPGGQIRGSVALKYQVRRQNAFGCQIGVHLRSEVPNKGS